MPPWYLQGLMNGKNSKYPKSFSKLSSNTIQFEPGHCNAHGSNLPKEVGVHSTKVLAGLYARDTSSHSPEGGTVNTEE